MTRERTLQHGSHGLDGHRRRLRVALISSLAVAVLAACGTAVTHPDARDAQWAGGKWPGTTVADLEHGRDIFVGRCSGCHDLPEPSVKAPDQWAAVLDEMARGAKLSDEERDLVLRYLSAASERARHSPG